MSSGRGAGGGVLEPGPAACPLTLQQRLTFGVVLGLLPMMSSGVFSRILSVVGCIGAAYSLYKVVLTLRAYHFVPKTGQIMAKFIPSYSLSIAEFYGADGAPPAIQEKRREGMARLEASFQKLMGPRAAELSNSIKDGLSDIRFTDTNRVPPPFQKVVRSKLNVCTVVEKSEGPWLVDVDGNKAIDVSGSYGVNVCGYGRYKKFTEEGMKKIADLGPNVLGPIHPVITEIIGDLKKISGLDEVSFHMSGTEAMMCAVRLCRFNTKRPLVAQFSGAYHGWWDGVQPGPGNERPPHDVICLKDMNPASLQLIRARKNEIACVCISPLQGLNPNNSPPSDMVLMDSKMRSTNDSIQKYTEWLHGIRALCTECKIPLIFDEVYTGFRMKMGGAQEYYGIQSDLVVYGKTLGGGLACGVCCGRSWLMRRFDPARPLRVAYVIGTFSAAPAQVACMSEFLRWLRTDEAKQAYSDGQTNTDEFISNMNRKLLDAKYPLRVQNLTTVWTVLFTQPGRYHWMYQYYLRAEGCALSWVGTGRCLFSLDFTKEDYGALEEKILAAARKMQEDGWWWDGVDSKQIKKKMAMEMFRHTLLPAKTMDKSA
mmetsp:Transcript_55123/g.131360  ORF Transcript_55123/g.131360 Transcript_55123/m.131360 type:complete len:596 (+) Transcript_55123:100-1887(+)